MKVLLLKGSRDGMTAIAHSLCSVFGRPFRAPHHTCSDDLLMQEVGLAFGGVLYIEEPNLLTTNTVKKLFAHVAMSERINCRAPTIIVAVGGTDRHEDLWPREAGTIDLDAIDTAAALVVLRTAEQVQKL